MRIDFHSEEAIGFRRDMEAAMLGGLDRPTRRVVVTLPSRGNAESDAEMFGEGPQVAVTSPLLRVRHEAAVGMTENDRASQGEYGSRRAA